MTSSAKNKATYPAFLDLHDRRVLVAGGGKGAIRKVRRLIDSGADVVVVANQISEELASVCQEHQFSYNERPVEDDDLKAALLLFAASDHHADNMAIAQRAVHYPCFVNVADTPSASNFLVPSLVDRSPLLVAVSSTGVSPVLARLLRSRIDAFLPASYSQLGQLADEYREKINQHIPDKRQRRRFWERLLSGRIGELILQGRTQNAHDAIQTSLDGYDQKTREGEVYLVGAGPGDPDLLSFRALRLMQQCDVVLYDRLVSDSIMALVNPEAELIYVGKQRSDHAVPQENINHQLASLAKNGQRVLRLKGGDPFMFGRGGEEIETLAAEGVDFQVVPGITAATGCASYAGIPLTHRDYAHACMFVAGHLKDGSVNLDWRALASENLTVVIYMGLVSLPVVCAKLIEHGLPVDHPAALIAQGTRSDQTVITSTLSSLPEEVSSQDIKPPTLIIIGKVVTLRDKLAWFENRR